METKYLFNKNNQNNLWKKINKHDQYILFLDYDGTLAKFKDNPAEASPLPGIPEMISKIDKFKNISTCIISGRPINQLKNFIDIPGIYYAGIHGLQIDGFEPITIRKTDNLTRLKNILRENITDNSIKLEDKKYVLTIHYPPNFEQENELVNFISKYIDNDYEIISGRNNLEVRPKDWNKGHAVKFLTRKIAKTTALPIYIGDDTTDEDAFKVIKGITIYVKNDDNLKTNAEYYINNPEEVFIFLKKFYNNLGS